MSQPVEPASTSLPIKLRLVGMMFLQYFVQGSYLPIISLYLQDSLGFGPQEIGTFAAALAIGPLLAPFILGQIVDRYASAEHVLASCHAVAGLLMLLLSFQTRYELVLVLGTLYSVLYIPTLMLTNAVAFHHLQDREREFPWIRLWGTIGFVVPAWFIELVLLRGLSGKALDAARGVALICSASAGLVMAGYCLTLPHTPPARMARARFAPAAVLQLLRRRDFAVLVLACFFIAMVHNFYFTWNSPFLRWFLTQGGIAGALEQRLASLGQIAEVAVMAGLGLMITRMGFKDVLALGAIAYLLRCLIFAGIPNFHGPYWQAMTLVGLGEALHGFCFGCFLAASFIYVDRICVPDVRGSMQTFYGTFVFGLGMVAGGLFSANVAAAFTQGTGPAAVRDWTAIWLAPAILATLTLAAFVVLFPAGAAKRAGEPAAEPPPAVDTAIRAARESELGTLGSHSQLPPEPDTAGREAPSHSRPPPEVPEPPPPPTEATP